MTVKAIPDGYHTLTAHLILDGAAEGIEFYERALGAEELFRMPGPDGKVAHAELKLGDSQFMLCDPFPEMDAFPPSHYGGSPTSFYVYVEDCDAAFARAIEAGAAEVHPVKDQFYGDRTGTVQDPYGYKWTLATHVKDLTYEEIHAAGQQEG